MVRHNTADHGHEFVANVRAIKLKRNIWTDLIIIHDRPSHPHSQGGIKMANEDLETQLDKWIEDH